jgi:hypothetical protein
MVPASAEADLHLALLAVNVHFFLPSFRADTSSAWPFLRPTYEL